MQSIESNMITKFGRLPLAFVLLVSSNIALWIKHVLHLCTGSHLGRGCQR